MKSFLSSLSFAKITIFLFSFVLVASADHSHEGFLKCLTTPTSKSNSTFIPESIIYTPNKLSYSTILNSTTQNPRFLSSPTRDPIVIVTPFHTSHIKTSIDCSKKHGVQMRIRSGGHDYEGLSYMSNVTFFILDLRNLSSVDIDLESKTAWVQAGVTLGELAYWIDKKSKTLGFPGSVCHTVCVGGQLGGGGYGYSTRKYGLASDRILDAQLMDAEGRILDRKSMGEDLFWAIRGGGLGSFGIVLAWKIQLVDVPPTLTVIEAARNWEDNATKKFFHRYQRRCNKIDKDLSLFVSFRTMSTVDKEGNNKTEMGTLVTALFHGKQDRLLPLMQKEFPELGLLKEECKEMTWIQTILYFNVFRNGESSDALLSRTVHFDFMGFKLKSDYVKKPIPDDAFEKLLGRLYEEAVGQGYVELFPYGGKMDQISDSAIPFPHRAGNLYNLRYMVSYQDDGNITKTNKHLSWVRSVYNDMTPYVSSNPRGAYQNFRDLDIGVNPNKGDTKSKYDYDYVKQASIWGTKYFKNNFYRLVYVKTMVDPTNFLHTNKASHLFFHIKNDDWRCLFYYVKTVLIGFLTLSSLNKVFW